MVRTLEAGDRVAFTRPWLERTGARYAELTGRAFPLHEGLRGRVESVRTNSCTKPHPKTLVWVTWQDGDHRWCSGYPRSALRPLRQDEQPNTVAGWYERINEERSRGH